MFALKGLYASQFVRTHSTLSLLMALWGLLVNLAHLCHLLIKVWGGWRRQPIADTMGLQIPLFSSRLAWRGEICSTICRFLISSASSRPVHWLMGRLDSRGVSQAKATIWQYCSPVIVAGLPGRGASSS